ncbi:MAG: signal peptidase II, partial [Oscillospiraceae bacterium]|nr:signal peptidase II [Oscillospiraceae bacterium]
PMAVLTAVILSVVDQLIKIIIYTFDFNAKLVGSLLRIEPTENLNQTAMFNFLNLELDSTFIIIFKAVLILVLFFIFIKLKNKGAYIWYAFVLLFSASIANLADSVAWGYTLDYVLFSRLTCYDLKDFYVDTAIGFVIIEFLYNKKKQEVKE